MALVDGRGPRGSQRRRSRRRWFAAVGLWSAYCALWLYVQVAPPPFMSLIVQLSFDQIAGLASGPPGGPLIPRGDAPGRPSSIQVDAIVPGGP